MIRYPLHPPPNDFLLTTKPSVILFSQAQKTLSKGDLSFSDLETRDDVLDEEGHKYL